MINVRILLFCVWCNQVTITQSQMSSGSDNPLPRFLASECEEESETGTKYYACTSEPLHVMYTAEYHTTIEPKYATCGQERESYCPMHAEDGLCRICDGNVAEYSHPLSNIWDRLTDDTPNMGSWWQSVTWQNYPDPLHINLTFSFNKSHELSDNLQITFHSSRPRAMLILTSKDYGDTWNTLQVFAKDCEPYWRQGLHMGFTRDNPNAVVCTESYSSITPYSGGKVEFSARARFHLFLGDDYANFDELYSVFDATELDEMLQFTDIRFQLIYPATDNSIGIAQVI